MSDQLFAVHVGVELDVEHPEVDEKNEKEAE